MQKALIPQVKKSGAVPNLDPFFFLDGIRRGLDKADEPLTDAYVQHPWVNAATRAVSRGIASVPFKLWKDEEFKSSAARKTFLKRMNALETFEGTSAIRTKMLKEFAPERKLSIDMIIDNARTSKGISKADYKKIQKLAGFDEVKAHAIIDLFDQPNTEMTGFEFWEATISYLIARGACMWILRDNEEGAIPASIEVYEPKGWEPKVNERGSIISWKWTHMVPNKEGTVVEKVDVFPAHQIIFLKNFNPKNLFQPLPWSRSCMLSIQQDHEAMIYNKAFFKNGAESGVVLETEQTLGKDHKKTMMDAWEARHSGSRHAHKTALLDGGVKAKVLRESHRDMEFRLLRESSRDEILGVHQTPKAIAGIIEDVNRATFLGSKKTFFELTLIPIMELISHVVYAKLIKPFDPTLFGFFDIALVEGLRGDVKEKAEVALIYHKMGVPFNLINRRLDLGFTDIDYGDIGFLGNYTVEQIANGETLSIGDNQFSGQAGEESDEEDDTPEDLVEDSDKAIRMNNKDFQDDFSINESIIANRLIKSFSFKSRYTDSFCLNITKLVVDSILYKYASVKATDKDYTINDKVSVLIRNFHIKMTDLDEKSAENQAVIRYETIKFSRLLTVKLVNHAKFKALLAKDTAKKVWLLGENCIEGSKCYDIASKGESIHLGQRFAGELLYPGDFTASNASPTNCQCSIAAE